MESTNGLILALTGIGFAISYLLSASGLVRTSSLQNVALACVAAMAINEGHLLSEALFFLPLLPSVVVFLGGRKQGYLSLVSSLATILLLAATQITDTSLFPIFHLASLVGALGISFILSSTYATMQLELERIRERQFTMQQSNLERENSQLENWLLTDPLTKVGSRVLLEQELTSLCHSQNTNFALLYLELNGFKAVNDTHGHEAGDRVLVETGKAIRRKTRATDITARLGGDEFAIILPEVSGEKALANIASDIASAVEPTFSDKDDQKLPLSASIGTTLYQPGEEARTVLARADKAMFRAKRSAAKGPVLL